MAKMEGLDDAEFFMGDIDTPLPDWRKHKDRLAEIDDDDAEFRPMSDEARARLDERLGIDTLKVFARFEKKSDDEEGAEEVTGRD